MCDVDPILQELADAAARAGMHQTVVYGFDVVGRIWKGRPISSGIWAGEVARTPAEEDRLAEAAADSRGYLHLVDAAFLHGDRWEPIGAVRFRMETISTWWTLTRPIV
jgi:hypothetical protein